MQTEKVREGSEENGDHMNVDDFGKSNIAGDNEEQSEEKNTVPNTEEQSNNTREAGNNVVTNGKYKLRRNKGQKNTKEINEVESPKSAINKAIRQKDYTEWTEDLHAKFVEAVQQLGEGRCYPKDILEVMNVPGLTEMQVASHLEVHL
ncbi:hypothetical protein HAX54_028108 [Datura stramonium]|uniref:HTH myb-type domain-containing protein n=1 Tax=Datura stramonium TaxID=4076 RepID=A0ABS8S9B4_DATST|nr:hypothetical protein [Datura stramonium]